MFPKYQDIYSSLYNMHDMKMFPCSFHFFFRESNIWQILECLEDGTAYQNNQKDMYSIITKEEDIRGKL